MTKRYSKERSMPIAKKRHRENRDQKTHENHSSRPNIVVDAGVLLDIEPVWLQCAQQYLRRELVKISNALSLPDRYGLSSMDAMAVMENFEKSGCWARIELFPEARAVMCALKELGATVWIMANTPEACVQELNLSLAGIVEPRHILTMGNWATAQDRVQKLKSIQARGYLDLETCTLNAAVDVVPFVACWYRGYSGLEIADAAVTIIDELSDFPAMLFDWLRYLSMRMA